MRSIADPFVVAPPQGMRIRTSLHVSEAEHAVLWELGSYLGSLAGKDLAERCAAGPGPKHLGRAERKKALTPATSSRWAGSITRTSDDSWHRGMLNLCDERRSKRRAVAVITRRLAVPCGERVDGVRGYKDKNECHQKHSRLQKLQSALDEIEQRIEDGHPSVCRGSKRLANTRHNLEEAELTLEEYLLQWRSSRLFLTADGDSCYKHGNGLIAVDPDNGTLRITLPQALACLANTEARSPMFELSAKVKFGYNDKDWEDQVRHGSVRYDITYDPDKDRWYLDASWAAPRVGATLDSLMDSPVLALDLNADHLAAVVVAPNGNPVGLPGTVELYLDGPSARRDGQMMAAITALLDAAEGNGCLAIAIENLNFACARDVGRETMGRGKRGKKFRRTVAGMPTAKFRERLVAMAYRRGIAVIAVDPAYTSKWGREHWLKHLNRNGRTAWSAHHAAAVVIGRRSLNHKSARGRRYNRQRSQSETDLHTPEEVTALPPEGRRSVSTKGRRGREQRPCTEGIAHPQPADGQAKAQQTTAARDGRASNSTTQASRTRNRTGVRTSPQGGVAQRKHQPLPTD